MRSGFFDVTVIVSGTKHRFATMVNLKNRLLYAKPDIPSPSGISGFLFL